MVFEKEKETPCLCAKIVTTPQALDWLRSKKFILNHREQNSGAKISITQSYAKKNGKRYILPSRKPNDFLGKMYIYIALQVMPFPRLVRYLTCFERYVTRSAVMHLEHITLVVSHPLVVRGDIRKHKSYAITIALSVT